MSGKKFITEFRIGPGTYGGTISLTLTQDAKVVAITYSESINSIILSVEQSFGYPPCYRTFHLYTANAFFSDEKLVYVGCAQTKYDKLLYVYEEVE